MVTFSHFVAAFCQCFEPSESESSIGTLSFVLNESNDCTFFNEL